MESKCSTKDVETSKVRVRKEVYQTKRVPSIRDVKRDKSVAKEVRP